MNGYVMAERGPILHEPQRDGGATSDGWLHQEEQRACLPQKQHSVVSMPQ
eukprot:COSAG06_NODE_16754_length_982_cov_23.355606_1_plen_50_part_00